jgi:hypothetical protein
MSEMSAVEGQAAALPGTDEKPWRPAPRLGGLYPCCPEDDDKPCSLADVGHDLPCEGPHCTPHCRTCQCASLPNAMTADPVPVIADLGKAE